MFAYPKVVKIFPDVFFRKLYILAASIFISKIHLELIFLYSVRFFFFPYGYEVFSVCWKYFPFPIECLWSLCWKSIDYIIVSLFLASLLLHWSVCLPLCYHSHLHGSCSFRVHLKVRLWVLKFCSLQGCLGDPESLDFSLWFLESDCRYLQRSQLRLFLGLYWIYSLQNPDINPESSKPWMWYVSPSNYRLLLISLINFM